MTRRDLLRSLLAPVVAAGAVVAAKVLPKPTRMVCGSATALPYRMMPETQPSKEEGFTQALENFDKWVSNGNWMSHQPPPIPPGHVVVGSRIYPHAKAAGLPVVEASYIPEGD